MTKQIRQQLDRAEIGHGPWFSDDRPEDVLHDIRSFCGKDARDVTMEDVCEFLRTKRKAFAPNPWRKAR